jgi:hypothetical protein
MATSIDPIIPSQACELQQLREIANRIRAMIGNHGHRLVSTAEIWANSSNTVAVIVAQKRTDSGVRRVTVQAEPV